MSAYFVQFTDNIYNNNNNDCNLEVDLDDIICKNIYKQSHFKNYVHGT